MNKRNNGKLNIIVTGIGLIGLVIMSLIAIIDSNAKDIESAIVVQLFFVALFVSGYISIQKK